MTASALIYALGGGHGHAMRGQSVQQMLAQRGCDARLFLRNGSERHLTTAEKFGPTTLVENFDVCRAPAADLLIVDTFPSGWQGELQASFFSRFQHKTFIARFNRNVVLSRDCAQYDSVLFPYPEGANEWPANSANGASIGYLLRRDRPVWIPTSRTLAIIDTERRCSPQILSQIVENARQCGFRSEVVHSYTTHLSGEKLLVVGAGYNSFYELLQQHADAVFIPIHKRYDDQVRRCEMWGRRMQSLRQLRAWLDDRSFTKEAA